MRSIKGIVFDVDGCLARGKHVIPGVPETLADLRARGIRCAFMTNENMSTRAQVVDKLTRQLGVNRYALYVMDYGAPVGFRLASKNPDQVTALIVQNGNAYNEGLEQFWDPIKAYWGTGKSSEREAIRWLTSLAATKWQYTNGVKDASLVSPDTWTMDQALLDRPGNSEIQLDLFYDYRTNVELYPAWQAFLRERQPKTLILWGQNDVFFTPEGGDAYLRDLPDAELIRLDTGHFAVEDCLDEIAGAIRRFHEERVAPPMIAR